MPQTRMFRDRVVSMEQTLEGGEKHLELLKTLCREALPEFGYTGHLLDHERDLFVIELAAPDGRRKTIAWTRMVLFDQERLPAIAADPASPVRDRVVGFLRSRNARGEIVVTFRHIEEGWMDTPEARPLRPSRRRGRRGGRVAKGGAPAQAAGPGGPGRPGERPPGGAPPQGRPPRPPGGGIPAQVQAGVPGSAPSRSGRRRRSRRRRRGGGGPGGPGPSPGRTP